MLGLLTALRLRFRALFNRQHDRELREELECHIEQLAEHNRAAGLGQHEARAAAHRQLGNLTRFQEQSHDLFGFRSFEDLGKDLRYSARGLMKRPTITVVAVLSLAMGIGGNTAVFSVVDAMVFRPFPYDNPDRLVMLRAFETLDPTSTRTRGPWPDEYLSWKQHTDVFEEMAFENDFRNIVVSSKGHPSGHIDGNSVPYLRNNRTRQWSPSDCLSSIVSRPASGASTRRRQETRKR